MEPAELALLVLSALLANDTALQHCACRHVGDVPGLDEWLHSDDVLDVRDDYCTCHRDVQLLERCDTLQPPDVVLPALADLLPRGGGGGGGGAGVEGEGGPVCSGMLAGLSDLYQDDSQFFSLFTDFLHSCSEQQLHGIEWNLTTPATSDLSHRSLPELLHTLRRIIEVTARVERCGQFDIWNFTLHYDKREYVAMFPDLLQRYTSYWRDAAQLISLGVPLISELVVPLATKHLEVTGSTFADSSGGLEIRVSHAVFSALPHLLQGNHTNDQHLHEWTKKIKHLRDMVNTNLMGLLHDERSFQEQIQNYKIEEDKNNPGTYLIRRPLMGDALLSLPRAASLREDFGEACEARPQLAGADRLLALADAIYSFYSWNWFPRKWKLLYITNNYFNFIDEEWDLEDQSNVTLSVDTECLQLLANGQDRRWCPLEELPPEADGRRRQCRLQLWQDLVLRPPPAPVTSYLAYTQRAAVSLCLLAWMVASSHGICQDVPFSIVQSVHDARCYFQSPENPSCLESKATDAICYISRAILLLKCQDFSTLTHTNTCAVYFDPNGAYSEPLQVPKWREKTEHTQRTLTYKDSATLKYKNFKIDSLKALEVSFVSLNIVFRLLTVGVYAYVPQLRNLPGKLLLCFQATGLVQVLCSEVLHRAAGVPSLSAAVLVDSCLTLLSCLWLNTFCYQMYGYVRHLRLPNDLLPVEARKIFRLQVVYVLMPCGAVCAACSALEITSKHYLLYSRIVIVIGISLSVTFNLVCLGLVAYMYLHTRKSMQQLKIYTNDKFASKKDVVFMSVKTVILSGIGIIIRLGFHQARDIAQFVYYVHIASMMQGPALFVFFVCNRTTLPVLKKRIAAWRNSDTVSPEQELCSAAERNLERRAKEQRLAAESSL